MPFQSEKQRKYLWANEPAIAKRWEKYPKGYNTGGVSHLFRSKEDRVGFNAGSWKGNPGTDSRSEVREAWKDFLEYRKKGGDKNWQKYMPIWIGANLAHGGYVRPEDSGVLGLAGGGQLVKPGPGRPGYNGWESDFSTDWGGEAEPQGAGPGTDPGPGIGGGGDGFQGEETFVPTYSEQLDDLTTTTGDGDAREKYIATQYTSPEALAAKKRRELRNLVNRQEEEKRDYVAPPKKRGFWGTMGLLIGAYTGLAPLFGIKIGSGVRTASFILNKRSQINSALKYGKKYGLIDKNMSFDGFVKDQVEKAKINYKENLEKIKANKAKLELYKSLPDGHPEKIALSIELEIGKKPEHLGDGDGDKGPIDITYENIEETNKQKEMIAASKRQYDMTYGTEDRSKQMAYWQSLMAPYMGGAMGMAAEGGRVPGGYNTGGLSNLFRLKNR